MQHHKKISLLFLSIGVLINQWLLSFVFSTPNGISLPSKIVLWAFQLACFGTAFMFFRWGESPDGKKKIKYVWMTVVLVVILLEIGIHLIALALPFPQKEVAYAFPRYELSPYKETSWGHAYWDEFNSLKGNFREFIGWRRTAFSGDYITIDAQGVRKTWNPTNIDTRPHRTIWMFGGSTLWGTGARDEFTIPSYLSKKLNEQGIPVKIVNFGESGFTALQEEVYLSILLRDAKPDFVIFYDGLNDSYAAYQSGTPQMIQNADIIKNADVATTPLQHARKAVIGALKEYSGIYKTMEVMSDYLSTLWNPQNKFQEIAAKYSDEQLQDLAYETSAEYQKTLSMVDKLSRTHGFSYRAFWQPTIFDKPSLTSEEESIDPRTHDKNMARFYHLVTENIRSIQNVADVSSVFKDTSPTMFIDFVHVSEEANRLIADAMFPAVKSMIMGTKTKY